MKDRKQNDTANPTTFVLKDSKGLVNLALATSVRLVMFDSCSGIIKVNAPTVILDQLKFRGQVRYDWQAADVDTVGSYGIEFLVTFIDGTTARFPTSPLGYEPLKIIPTRVP